MADIENDQGNVLRQHDPQALFRENEELRQKLAALERNTVVSGAFQGEAPRYLLNEPAFIDDTYFVAGTVIEFFGPPARSMVPQNAPADRALRAEIAKLEEGARKVAALRGREFFGLVTDRNVLIDTAMADAKAKADADTVPSIPMPVPAQNIQAMPTTLEAIAAAKRGPGRPRKVVAAVAPQPQTPDAGTPILGAAPAGAHHPPAVLGRFAG